MTLFNDVEIKCGVCGKTSIHPMLLSTNSFGSPDLDLRPPGMARDTMNTWILECPHCGYVNKQLDSEAEISIDFLKTEKYLTCDGFEFKKDLAGRFFKSYLISKEKEDLYECYYDLLHCAWACDDADDVENAKKIRKLAITYLEQMIEKTDDKNDFLLMKADLLRRCGEFDRVSEEYKDLILGEEIRDKIITFHLIKANEGDDSCYTVDDALEYHQK